MINHIEGKLVEKTPTYAVIEAGGIGYYLNISIYTFERMSTIGLCKLLTHQVIREDAHLLFGFADEAERILFRHLISVSGVGANTARVMLSTLSPVEIQQAITTNNAIALQNIKGIGTKTALRIIIDLKEKLTKVGSLEDVALGLNSKSKIEALIALQSLGFLKGQAEKALEKASKTIAGEMTVEQLIKSALKFL